MQPMDLMYRHNQHQILRPAISIIIIDLKSVDQSELTRSLH